MDDLVETLAIGLIVSLILIVVSWWFWKRYDRPSEAQLEREESIAKKKEETRMWRTVEAQMSREKAALEEKALYERRKAEERARAMPPPSSEVSDAFAAFSAERQAKPSFEQSEPALSAEAALAESMFEIRDDDVLDIEEPVEVRQDQGVLLEEGQALPDMPEDVELEDVEPEDETFNIEQAIPPAPDLDALIGTDSSKDEEAWPTTDELPADDVDWSDNWFKNLEEE
ncbi:hypothetical protein N9O16_01905 [Candidatus Poseidoniaceae archaeon]|nr:hypothetical protein [Euryarchaeota archaeon]MDA9166226.1 hypothetical protein [Candidatus Poseidoniaceae archaeon]MDB2593707.1 hypothetical protein [Euryarchaeota archaeon]MDC3235956.1 hypothetical protein [Candidatus Poseidoniaceae archaeon]